MNRFLLALALVSAPPFVRGEAAFPPELPGGVTHVTETSEDFLKPPPDFPSNVAIAKAAPTMDFAFYPGQDYPGKPWSAWGDSLAVNGKDSENSNTNSTSRVQFLDGLEAGV